jgi:hypothetical protein
VKDRFIATVATPFKMVADTYHFAEDQVLGLVNGATLGWLASKDPYVAAASQRNIERADGLFSGVRDLSIFTLRLGTGNMGFDEAWDRVGGTFNRAMHADEISALEAKGDYVQAQMLRTENVLNVATLGLAGWSFVKRASSVSESVAAAEISSTEAATVVQEAKLASDARPFIQLENSGKKIYLTDEYAREQGWLINSRGGLLTGQYVGNTVHEVEASLRNLMKEGFPEKGGNQNVYQHIMGDGADSAYRGASLEPRVAASFATGPGGYGVVFELGPVKGYDAAKVVADAPRLLGSPLLSSANASLALRADELEVVISNRVNVQQATGAKLFYRDPANPTAAPRFVRNLDLTEYRSNGNP